MLSLSKMARDFFDLLESFGNNENRKSVCKRLFAEKSDPENRDFSLWTFSVLLLQELVFPRQKQQSKFVQKAHKPSN